MHDQKKDLEKKFDKAMENLDDSLVVRTNKDMVMWRALDAVFYYKELKKDKENDS